MENLLKWQIGAENDGFVATLKMNTAEGDIPVLIIYKNKKCYTSIPTTYVDGFITSVDISFEDVDGYIKENHKNTASDEVESLRLEYILKWFENDFSDQMNRLISFI